MKKIIISILSLVILVVMFTTTMPVANAADLYDGATNGDLLYKVNFNGDEIFKPSIQAGNVIVTVDQANNNKVSFNTDKDKTVNRWGGEFSGLPLGLNNAYTIKWSEIRENDIDGATGIYIDNVYGAYGYVTKHRIMKNNSSLPNHGYIEYSTANITPKATASDWTPQEYALEVNAQNKTIKLYILDINEQWKLLDQSEVGEISKFETANLGFYNYTYYVDKCVTLTDVAVYKGMSISGEVIEYMEETTAPETTAPETTTPPEITTTVTTKKLETTAVVGTTKTPAPTDTVKAPKKNCGKSSVIISVAQVVTTVGSCVIIIAFKKKL